jgi:hypothetical protein
MNTSTENPMDYERSTTAHAMNMAMHANLVALANQIGLAQKRATDARDAMDPRIQNRTLAVGILLPLERILPECTTLLSTIIALQSWHDRLPTQEGGAA